MGYATTQVLGGWLALRCGPKRVLLTAVFLWSLATLLTPAAAAADFGALVAARVLIGMGEGLLLPCLPALLRMPSTWSTKAIDALLPIANDATWPGKTTRRTGRTQ